jgi:UDP-glucose 4-epimerase
MYLITGGLGFIGLHTARAMLDKGEDVVLTQYRVAREPDFIKGELGKRAFVEQLDVTDRDRLLEIGKKHKITGIIHLAVPALNVLSPEDDFKVNMFGLLNILEVGRQWEVKRIGLASSNTVYFGVRGGGASREDMNLTMGGRGPASATATWKKSFELIGSYWANRTGLDIIMLRIAGIYGPLYHSGSNLQSRLVHAAMKGEVPTLRGDTYAEDGGDMTYVKDCGEGIARLMTTEKLNHDCYNVASGQMTKNRELAEAVQKVIPSFKLDFLKEGSAPNSVGETYADITRIRTDTGYEPQYPTQRAIEDYVAWLRAGNPF